MHNINIWQGQNPPNSAKYHNIHAWNKAVGRVRRVSRTYLERELDYFRRRGNEIEDGGWSRRLRSSLGSFYRGRTCTPRTTGASESERELRPIEDQATHCERTSDA